MVIFGLGYTAGVIAAGLEPRGWEIVSTGRNGTLAFDDEGTVRLALADADAVLSSVPPAGDGSDPVLARYGAALRHRWLGYLSSTGVYGDTGGAWVDETAPVGTGRRTARAECDRAWLDRGARVFRLPGIYGPSVPGGKERNPLDRVAAGAARRIDLPGQVFSRIHVADIASGVIAGLAGPAGAYNLADDLPCPQNRVIEEACRLLGMAPPPLQALDEAGLPPPARAFWAENRRIANGKARRVLGWVPAFPTYREGLRALSATSRPAMASPAPAAASTLQR